MDTESGRASYPPGISDKHVDITPRRPWGRWAAVVVLSALPVLALFNFFGQRETTSRATSPVASVSLQSPSRLRSGLSFQTKVQVFAHATIGRLELAFSPGWWDGVGVNSISPQPSTESSQGGQVVLEMGKLPAGRTLTTWLNFSVNPTFSGERSEDLTVLDGAHTLVRIHRSVTVFP
jgi:hypothetical protein